MENISSIRNKRPVQVSEKDANRNAVRMGWEKELTREDLRFRRGRPVWATSHSGLESVRAVVGRLSVHCRVSGSGEGRVDGRVVEIVVVRRRRAGGGGCGYVAGVGGGRVTLGNLRAVLRRCRVWRGSRGHVGLVWCRVGSGLEVGGPWLLLEDGIVAHTLALTLLTIATHGMRLVTLENADVSFHAKR